jgi:hypothetical protein
MSEKFANKTATLLLLVSLALIAMNLPVSQFDKISIPNTSVSVPAQFLWLAWLYLALAFASEVRGGKLKPFQRVAQRFNTGLTRWAKKRKDRECPDIYTPQNLVRPKSKTCLIWEFKYCQVGGNLEPSFVAVSNPTNTIRLFLIACTKTFLSLEMLGHVTLPVVSSVVAVLFELYVLLAHP